MICYNSNVILLVIFLFFIVTIWLIGFIKTNDINIPTKDIFPYKKILIIFPHPDDESLSVSGLVKKANKFKTDTTLLVLTKGGAGNSYQNTKVNLKAIREKEMKKSAKIIGIKNLIQLDFPDGELNKNRRALLDSIKSQMKNTQPDLVITYDLSGLYGHEDHIVISEIVTNLIKCEFLETKLWYVSYPAKVFDMITLPIHMAKNKDFYKKRVSPNLKIFVGFCFIFSYLSVMAHKSQYKSFRNEELWYIPLWFSYSTQIFEYYHEVNTSTPR